MRNSIYRNAVLLCGGLWAAFGLANVRAEAQASYQASDWDQEMVLPPNSYRASKPIGIDGGFTVKTQPGTLIDRVNFQTHGGRQHWHIEGTVMRQVRIGVKMGGSGHGIDSVFEDCEFNKDDSWFVQWWSTHWRFDNCIFTKKFIRDYLAPLDYSAHATKCTFYGVKLPGVGFKENPAGYMQKDDMVFEQCRFVDCEVPQTFLASTVDCVFEGCRFEAKNKVKWPKETGPIKVKAYYAGTGNEPASFLNGPLSVEFASAPRGTVYGCTLPHAQSGGRVTLTNGHLSEAFVAMGTVPKKASEVVDVVAVAAAPALTTLPPAPSAVLAATGGEIHGLDEVLRAMPSNIELLVNGEPNAAGVEAANDWLARTCAGRPVFLRMALESIQALKNADDAFQATGRPQGVLYHGAAIPSQAVGMFRAINALPLRRLQPNADFSVRGIVRKGEFVGRGHTLTFTLTIGEASVPDAVAAPPTALATPPIAAAATPRAAAVAKPAADYFGSAGAPAVPAAPSPGNP